MLKYLQAALDYFPGPRTEYCKMLSSSTLVLSLQGQSALILIQWTISQYWRFLMNNSKEQTYKNGIFFSSNCINLNNKYENIVHNFKKINLPYLHSILTARLKSQQLHHSLIPDKCGKPIPPQECNKKIMSIYYVIIRHHYNMYELTNHNKLGIFSQ